MTDPILAAEPDHPDRERLRQLGEKLRRRLAANKAVQPLPSDRAELWAVNGFANAAECNQLIAQIDEAAQPSQTYNGPADAALRTSCSAPLNPRDQLVRKVQRRMDVLLGLERAQAEMLQGQRYAPGQEFKPHTDWFPQASPAWAIERDRGGQRAFSAMLYLNDVTDGGETDFPLIDMAIAPRQGVLLVWNNADRDGVPSPFAVHAGNLLRSGSKYVVTRWYRCYRKA